MLKFTILGNPFGKVNMQPMKIGKNVRLFNPRSNAEYMSRIIWAVDQEIKNQILFEKIQKPKPIAITIVAFFEVPKACYRFSKKLNQKVLTKEGTKMLAGEILPTKKPDLDNISKIVCDAVTQQGEVWDDDSQIVCSLLLKKYSNKPRVEVCIEEFTEAVRDE